MKNIVISVAIVPIFLAAGCGGGGSEGFSGEISASSILESTQPKQMLEERASEPALHRSIAPNGALNVNASGEVTELEQQLLSRRRKIAHTAEPILRGDEQKDGQIRVSISGCLDEGVLEGSRPSKSTAC
ncbi:hypothetical protein [Variovorax sp. WS11]|uniref:hypothetical protein n=1 Tax=Variovorax sp. WS11 TaxID=1105204 RepID=UPI0011B247D3|nr:hypothetical protein [Variovorax sp. WS11]NDZ16973.1 hypothetical protein [Variovorax sp. WS11]